jgi:hypothetical protein
MVGVVHLSTHQAYFILPLQIQFIKRSHNGDLLGDCLVNGRCELEVSLVAFWDYSAVDEVHADVISGGQGHAAGVMTGVLSMELDW